MMPFLLSRKNNKRGKIATRQKGFTLFELVVVILLLCAFYYGLADRLLYYRAQAERAEVSWVQAAMKATLQGQQGVFYLSGEPERIASLAGANPMAMLGHPPPNYLGELIEPDIRKLPHGTWYFDKGNQCLVYLLNYEKYFADGHPKMLKFKVEFSRKPTPGMDGLPAGHAGVALEQSQQCNPHGKSGESE